MLIQGSSMIVEMNPISGNVEATVSLGCSTQQAFLLPHTTNDFLSILLVVCDDHQVFNSSICRCKLILTTFHYR